MEDQLTKAISMAETACIDLLKKSHVKAYSRTTASGASVQVKEHDDKRQGHEADMDAADEPVKKFKKGDKVKDNFGKVHEVLSQNGNSVKTYQSGADTIHASKLHPHDDSEAKTHDDMSEKFRTLAKQHYAKGTREGDATAREHIESAEYHEHEAKAARGETDKKNPHAGKNAHKLNDKMTQAYDRFHQK